MPTAIMTEPTTMSIQPPAASHHETTRRIELSVPTSYFGSGGRNQVAQLWRVRTASNPAAKRASPNSAVIHVQSPIDLGDQVFQPTESTSHTRHSAIRTATGWLLQESGAAASMETPEIHENLFKQRVIGHKFVTPPRYVHHYGLGESHRGSVGSDHRSE